MHSGDWGKFLPFGAPRTSFDVIITIGYYGISILLCIVLVYGAGCITERILGRRYNGKK